MPIFGDREQAETLVGLGGAHKRLANRESGGARKPGPARVYNHNGWRLVERRASHVGGKPTLGRGQRE